MSDALIANLQQTIERLTNENAKLTGENTDRRKANKKLSDRMAELEGAVVSLGEERDTLKTKLESAPNELQAKIDELTGEIRNRDHRAAFGKAAKQYKGEAGETVRDDALDAIWQLSGYKPDGDPDEAKLLEVVKAVTAKHPFTVAPADAGASGGTTATPATRPAGPGAQRTATAPTTTHSNPVIAATTRMQAVVGHSNPNRIA
jgi:hypothetical protein